MDRTTSLRVLAVGFFLYGLYASSFLPGMLVAPTAPILLIGTLAKTALAFASAIGIWTGQRWTSTTVVLTGVVIAALWLSYGFVLGIVAYLYAVAMAVVAVLVAIIAAAYVRLTATSG